MPHHQHRNGDAVLDCVGSNSERTPLFGCHRVAPIPCSGGSATGSLSHRRPLAVAGDANSCTPKPADRDNSFATASKRAWGLLGLAANAVGTRREPLHATA